MTDERPRGAKGYDLEEQLRAYFLRAGFFAVRSVPLQQAGEDMTDIDVWLYERPTGSFRRRQVVDAKSKTRPKAMERLLWTRGLVELLDVEGAFVATTDSRPMLRSVSRKLGISILDGTDLKRISESERVAFADRLTEEEFVGFLSDVDKARREKEFQRQLRDLKHSLVDSFGAGSANRSLEALAEFSRAATTSHPNSDAAKVALRLVYFASSLVAISLDFIVAEVSFRAVEERRIAIVNAIRFGDIDEGIGRERARVALALIERYAPNGQSVTQSVAQAVDGALKRIPAEIVADHVVKSLKPEELFHLARKLDGRAYARELVGFDGLGVDEKSFVATLLDFCGVDRARFASSVMGRGANGRENAAAREHESNGTLFGKDGLASKQRRP